MRSREIPFLQTRSISIFQGIYFSMHQREMSAFEGAMRKKVCLELLVWLKANQHLARQPFSPSPASLDPWRCVVVDSRGSSRVGIGVLQWTWIPGTNKGVVFSIWTYFRSALCSIPIPDKKRENTSGFWVGGASAKHHLKAPCFSSYQKRAAFLSVQSVGFEESFKLDQPSVLVDIILIFLRWAREPKRF